MSTVQLFFQENSNELMGFMGRELALFFKPLALGKNATVSQEIIGCSSKPYLSELLQSFSNWTLPY